jgi:TonB-like protein
LKQFFRSQRLGISGAGLVGTVLLHALIVLPLFLDLSLPSPHLPNRTGVGAIAVASSQEAVMTVVFIKEVLPAERTAPPTPLDLASRGMTPPDLLVVVFSPDSSPAIETAADPRKDEDSSVPPEAVGDQTQHALLYGRYLGQVQARIERAWMRPRTEIGAPRFSCGARIEQDRRGKVVGIKLDHCNGSERWQQSLRSAIQTASPLPAPPDPSVYADRLWLTFGSEGFAPGGSAQGIEPEQPETLIGDRLPSRESFEDFANRPDVKLQSRGKEDPKVFHLTIIGSPSAESPVPAGVSNAPEIAPPPPSSP